VTDIHALVEFLRACLDEDETMARAADVKQGDPEWVVHEAALTGGEWFRVRSKLDVRPIALVQRIDGDNGEPAAVLDASSVATHIARHDPATVLADVAAKRRVLNSLENAVYMRDSGDPSPVPWVRQIHGASVAALECAVLALAQAYAGRPGWREEWAAE
jgi:hypothetical protein